MNHHELWQLYNENGEAAVGETIARTSVRDANAHANVGAVHVWLWCRNDDNSIDVFLQRRSQVVKNHPGKLDISFAGHVDAGETPLDAAYREGVEELGYEIDTEKLVYIFGYRNFHNGTKWEYLYQVDPGVEFTFDDGEVSEIRRVPLDVFAEMIRDPEAHELVPHKAEYYSLLLQALRYFDENH